MVDSSSCSICKLRQKFEVGDKDGDVVEKIFKEAKLDFIPWGEKPVKCTDFDSDTLWQHLNSVLDKDYKLECGAGSFDLGHEKKETQSKDGSPATTR